jgi:biopolymer transport protein ExbD
MRIDLDDGSDATLDLAPLIDVVFLLLIFFMVATSFAQEEQRLDLELPEAHSGQEAGQHNEELVLDVLQDGSVELNGARLAPQALNDELSAIARNNPRRPVVVRADRGLDYGRVIAVLDQCRLVGLTNAGLATREG